jgi:hypothetical protein
MSATKDITQSLQQLKQLATDIGSSTASAFAVPRRCCFISVNSYTNPSVTLGTGPISDACTVATAAQFAGMPCFFVHNAKKADFLKWLDKFLADAASCLFFYYVGHGTQVPSKNNDESDGMDEAYYFEDGVLIDDVLLDHLVKSKNPNSSVILISDCCHSGSIWDLTDFQRDLPPRVISISAAQDTQTSKQIVVSKEVLHIVSKVEAGVFTSGMFDALKANAALSPVELKAKLDAQLRKYQQTVTLETTSSEMLNESLFLPTTAHEPPAIDAPPAVAAKPTSSVLASAGAATLAPLPAAAKPSGSAPDPKKYQQPVVTILKDGRKTELHKYFKKVRTDCTLDFHVISTTIEQSGRKPVVTHVIEIKKTDKNGRVTTSVHQYGDDMPWHAGKSKWSAPPVIATPTVTTAAAAPATTVAVTMPPPKPPAPVATWGQSISFSGESVSWEDLPPYFHTPEEQEKLKASQASTQLTTSGLKTVQDFMNATKKIYSKSATSNATYGFWYRT